MANCGGTNTQSQPETSSTRDGHAKQESAARTKGTKGVSFALFFLAIIYLSHYRSKSKTGLRIHLAGLIRLTRGSSRSLLGAPNACC